MKFTAMSCISLLISGALVSGCGQDFSGALVSGCGQDQDQASNVLEMNKIRSVVGMTKTEVKKVLGTPENASDTRFSYLTIQPDSGKKTTCRVWFMNIDGSESTTARDVDC